jgi:ABC-2 type transport system ATP-binding protein
MSEPLLLIQNLSKQFSGSQDFAIQDVSVSIPKGEIVGIVGPDGAGKTTLSRLIGALLIPTAGSIQVAGLDTVKDSEKIRSIAGYMPQKFGLYEDLTVLQNLNLYADLKGLAKEEKKETFEKLLKFTDLFRFTDRLAGALSGGMKQKLGLACALLKKPSLLILDEPSVGVDPISRRELWKMVLELLKEGISILWSTAYLDEAEKCDRVLLLNEGKLLYQGFALEFQKRVKGRTFTIKAKEPRKMLLEILEQEGVVDAILQGSEIRLCVKEGVSLKEDFKPVEPRFEDAFIDILGGAPKVKSLLAKTREAAQSEKIPVDAKSLTKQFGDFVAVEKVSFEVQKGEIFGLLGPNGAGKTTTFRMLCGLLHPSSGKAFVNGWDLEKAPGMARRQIGYMAQKFSLYGSLSVEQNLNFFAGAYNLEGEEKKKIVQKMVQIFSLQKYLTTSAEMLPLGIKQRLALACANMHSPAVLFLDEPTSGVDPITRREFWSHIHGLVEKGVSVMVTTHFMDEAEYCDRLALVYRGRIIHMDTPDALKAFAKTEQNLEPTLEDAFIKLIEEYDAC